jgi:hypothetical protein
MNSTATLMNTTCQAGTAFLISTEVKAVRMTFDGSTTPATSTGVLLTTTTSPLYLEGVNGAKLKFARAASGTILNIQAWSRP